MSQLMTNPLMAYTFILSALFITGLYCIIISKNLIRTLIGVEILTKAVTLLIILAGYVTGRSQVTQAMIITLIVVEVVVISVGAGLIINVFKKYDSLDTDNLRSLKG